MQNRRPFVPQSAVVLLACGLIASLLPGLAASCAYAADSVPQQRPNVVLIMADDLGYECLGCNGGESYQTPHLDQLAKTGVRFTHCFVNPLCTPTRVALMTGRYNFRNYTQFGTLPAAEPTFGHMMQDAGYATCIAGKWQLEGKGGTTPDRAGFDEYCMYGGNPHADPDIKDNDWVDVQQKKGEYGPKLMVDYLCDFLDRQSEEPFFIYYPMHLPHFPFEPTPDSDVWESGNRHDRDDKYFTDMVEYMDKLIGRIVGKLEELGIRENTLIMFLGDNGTQFTLLWYHSLMESRSVGASRSSPRQARTFR